MNITQENIDELNAVIKIKVTPDDYQNQVETVIKKYQKTATQPGFRPGKVPAGMIKKMYGKSVLVEELNKIISDSLNKYIADKQLAVFGNPLPKANEDAVDWDNPNEFEFSYDLGLVPAFELALSPDETFPYYTVDIDNEMLDNYIADIQRRYGDFSNPELSEEKDVLYGTFEELDDAGNIKENGITNTTTLALEFVKNEEEKKKFLGLKKEDAVIFNPMKAIENATEVAAMLKIDKEKTSELNNLKFTVKTINRIIKAEVNQDLFDKLYGEGQLNSEEEFREKVKSEVMAVFNIDSDKKLRKDIINGLLEKFNLSLPDEFLKKWMMTVNEKPITREQLEQEYPHYTNELKWRLIENKIVQQHNLSVAQEEMKLYAKQLIRNQYAQYGQMNIEEDKLETFSEQYLQNNEESKKIADNIINRKVFELLKSTFHLDIKALPYEEFVKVTQ